MLLRLKTKLIEEALVKEYESYSQAGKQITLKALHTRKSDCGITLAIEAINGTASEATAGYRLLRDCATAKEADILISNLIRERNGLASIQSAVAAAAKRDTTGAYINKLRAVYKKSKGEKRESLLRTFAQIGSKKLLKLTVKALKDDDLFVSNVAVTALVSWENNDSIKALMIFALESPDSKQRIQAKNGIVKKLSAKKVNKAPYKKIWSAARRSPKSNAEIKKQLDEFFSK